MEHKELCKICGKPIRYGVPHVGHSPPFRVGEQTKRKRRLVHPILNCPVKGCAFSARMQSTIKGHLKSIHGMGFRGTPPLASPPPSPGHHYPTDSQPDPVTELEKQMGSLTFIPKGGKRSTHSRRRSKRKTQRRK
jgi:hypothetical protein